MYRTLLPSALLALPAVFLLGQAAPGPRLPNLHRFENSTGQSATFTSNGAIDFNNPYFMELGTNGRSCATCHQPDQGWTISADKVKARFDATQGMDPIFRTNDGSNCDHDIDTTTLSGRANAYSLLTSRGLIRITLDVPADAEFEVASVQNPYGCNGTAKLSLYRRPLPAANLRSLTTVMWDGRESTAPSTENITLATNPSDLLFDLGHQATGAILGHAQGLEPPTAEQERQIVDFELALSTAQIADKDGGELDAVHGAGGPSALSRQPFYVGINDPFGADPTGAPFTPVIFTLFQSWLNLDPHVPGAAAKMAIARGEELFNSRTIHIRGVAGLNDELGVEDFPGSCGTCHNTPNFGNHSLSVPLRIGVTDADSPLDVSYLPVITLRNKTTGDLVQTTDPGRALITGKWRDIGKIKGPGLRGLASRPPYFHNGSAKTLMDVLNFYDVRFNMGLTDQEKSDLVAFLNAL